MGFGIFLIILSVMMPAVFSELTKTLIIFLQSAEQALAAAGLVASHATNIIPQ